MIDVVKEGFASSIYVEDNALNITEIRLSTCEQAFRYRMMADKAYSKGQNEHPDDKECSERNRWVNRVL